LSPLINPAAVDATKNIRSCFLPRSDSAFDFKSKKVPDARYGDQWRPDDDEQRLQDQPSFLVSPGTHFR
jgi:hypothetical protein